jgi:hypothetical protein
MEGYSMKTQIVLNLYQFFLIIMKSLRSYHFLGGGLTPISHSGLEAIRLDSLP